jgi:nucleoside-diphosphate-sugar epimerase
MKVILTGATGFCGGEILQQLLQNDNIEQVTVISRRELSVKHEKLNTIIHSNFEDYSAVIPQVIDHNACIWTIGGKRSDFKTDEEYTTISVTYTVQAAKAFSEIPNLKFLYLSGMGADQTESQSFWVEEKTRHTKGRVEKQLSEIPNIELYLFRPGGIVCAKSFLGTLSKVNTKYMITVQALAKVLIHIAMNGNETKIFENDHILKESKKL